MPETEAVKDTFQKYLAQGKGPIFCRVLYRRHTIRVGMEVDKARYWYTTEIQKIWAKYNCNPIKSMMPLFANGFVFVSFFISLRGLSEIKVLFQMRPIILSVSRRFHRCVTRASLGSKI